ncbi:phosphotransferase [Actinobacteria bacterium IMCC26103]|nr:phosphotransferase [Actinobacteria bacterium IMCC26103]
MLDQGSVLSYLVQRGLLTGNATVEILTGGVSCVVLAVYNGDVDLVVKQALPELKTKAKWVADQRRAIVEADAMQVYHSITPDSVPKLLDCDPTEFTLTMTRLPRSCTNWKIDILEGRIYPEMGASLGKVLAAWHNAAAVSDEIKEKFMEDSLFEQLRVAPFYRAVMDKNPVLQPVISVLIDEITTLKITLVHGDFSPKNIMASTDHSPIVLDFEVAHIGNPVFDLAFLLAHLLCKIIHAPQADQKQLLVETAKQFLASYQKTTRLSVATSLPHHVALIALARVEGVSPVNYLDESDQLRLVALTKSALLDSGMTVTGLLESAAK